MFKKRTSIKQVEEGKYLSPKFNKDGLIPVITTDYKTKEVLMHGFMNKLALQKTIETGEAFIGADQERLCGIKAQPVALFKK